MSRQWKIYQILRGSDGWEFYYDKAGEWRWRRIDTKTSEIVGATTEGYDSFEECLENARINGFRIGIWEWMKELYWDLRERLHL